MENWNRLRAPFWPYFFRSCWRGSRVKKPSFFSRDRSSALNSTKARAIPKTGRARLAGHTTAVRKNQQVKLLHGLSGRKRLPHHGARTFRGKVILKRAVIDLDLALAGP